MDSLYLEVDGLLKQVHASLAQLESSNVQGDALLHEQNIQSLIATIISNCERLDIMVAREPPSRKRNAKYRVDQLKYDCQHLRAALASLMARKQSQWKLDTEREQLLNRRFTTNETAIAMGDEQLQHNNQLRSTNRYVDDLLSSGASILENLRHQEMSLKGVKRKVLDLANTLGLSNSVMRLIERRTAQDKVVLFGGMILTLVIMFLLYKWLK